MGKSDGCLIPEKINQKGQRFAFVRVKGEDEAARAITSLKVLARIEENCSSKSSIWKG